MAGSAAVEWGDRRVRACETAPITLRCPATLPAFDMTTLLVRGLDDGAGPGDIVGAFVNETAVDPDDIGDIDVDGDEATVDVADDAVDEVASAMDGGRVGSSEVRVHERDDAVREYVEHYSDLVELEGEAEMERHEGEIRSLSGRSRSWTRARPTPARRAARARPPGRTPRRPTS